jgi:hypothetical protein
MDGGGCQQEGIDRLRNDTDIRVTDKHTHTYTYKFTNRASYFGTRTSSPQASLEVPTV